MHYATPDAAICHAEVQSSGVTSQIMRGVPLLGYPVERVLTCLKFMDHAAFRALIRGTALARTSGLLLSDFDPYDSYGTETRFLMELAPLGEFRFVPGPHLLQTLAWRELVSETRKVAQTLEAAGMGLPLRMGHGGHCTDRTEPGGTPAHVRHGPGPLCDAQQSMEAAKRSGASVDK
jgi:hypothetical protein